MNKCECFCNLLTVYLIFCVWIYHSISFPPSLDRSADILYASSCCAYVRNESESNIWMHIWSVFVEMTHSSTKQKLTMQAILRRNLIFGYSVYEISYIQRILSCQIVCESKIHCVAFSWWYLLIQLQVQSKANTKWNANNYKIETKHAFLFISMIIISVLTDHQLHLH